MIGSGGSFPAAAAARALTGWYAVHARDLPWRRTTDPYLVLVSEFMLQQTTVETVIPYFERFVAAFPDVRALAGADEARVLALWSGLGYYRRARNLHAAARAIVRDHSGVVPDDAESLKRLPGVGPYTAAAILAIAFHRAEPALDANLKRVLARLGGVRVDPATRRGEALLRAAGEEIVRAGDPSILNQALMDLGAALCAPRAPRCLICPLSDLCEARRLGAVDRIPAAKERSEPVAVALAAVVARRGERLLMRRRGGDLMAGMWEFPMAASIGSPGDPRATGNEIERIHGIACSGLRSIGSIRHTITRHRIRVEIFEGRASVASPPGRRSHGSTAGGGPPVDSPPWSVAESGEGPAGNTRRRESAEAGAPRGTVSHMIDAASAAEIAWQPRAGLAGLPLTGIARKIARALEARVTKGVVD